MSRPDYSISMPISFNETYWVRFDLEGTSLSGKIWQGAVGDEPVGWQLTCTNAFYGDAEEWEHSAAISVMTKGLLFLSGMIIL